MDNTAEEKNKIWAYPWRINPERDLAAGDWDTIGVKFSGDLWDCYIPDNLESSEILDSL